MRLRDAEELYDGMEELLLRLRIFELLEEVIYRLAVGVSRSGARPDSVRLLGEWSPKCRTVRGCSVEIL